MSGGFVPAEPHRRKLTRVPDGAAVVPGHGAPLLAEIEQMRVRRAAIRAGQVMDDDIVEQAEPARVAATDIARQAGAIAAGQSQRPGKMFGVTPEYLAARQAEERKRKRRN